ncbi:MAG: DUF4743 domain-containing protein [Rubrivivax sp.]
MLAGSRSTHSAGHSPGQDTTTTPAWSALDAAVAHDPSARVPFFIGPSADEVRVGSVARAHLPELAGFAPALQIAPDRVSMRLAGADRDSTLEHINRQLRAHQLIHGWREETITLWGADGIAPLARIERAAARFWGTLTLGAHATGYVARDDGRPEKIWIAQRAFDKATDPGCFDNLVGGGVADGQTPSAALVREGREEAGLTPALMQHVKAAGVLRMLRDIPEGLQHEHLHAFDLALPSEWQPSNQDGEVAGFQLLPVAEAITLAAGHAMTVDAALVTLDFALRHGLLSRADSRVYGLADGLAPRIRALRIATPVATSVAPGVTGFNGSEGARQGP